MALADADGALALACQRLEEMFGYEHGELLGQNVERLIPAEPEEARRSHRAAYAEEPGTRPMTDRLVGLRKDATTFLVEISLSPVTTAAGRFAIAVIRDVAAARQLEDLIDLARSAATAEQAHRSRELLDSIITRLFQLGLRLQAALDLPADAVGQSSKKLSGIWTTRSVRSATLRSPPPTRLHPAPHRRKVLGAPRCNGRGGAPHRRPAD